MHSAAAAAASLACEMMSETEGGRHDVSLDWEEKRGCRARAVCADDARKRGLSHVRQEAGQGVVFSVLSLPLENMAEL